MIALSLVLAMLLFKPAPLYILDEVDAALDLSHTQNIGTMLKAHFKQSQVINYANYRNYFNSSNIDLHDHDKFDCNIWNKYIFIDDAFDSSLS